MSGLVTGEAVALGMDPAKLPSRALAISIDLVVYWTGFVGLMFFLAAATASLDDAAVAAVSIGGMLLILVGAPIAVETLTRGRSLGKLACGLRVVRDDGGPIRFRHALVRGAVGVVEIQLSLGVIACIASLVSARGRRLGDVFAGTLVVRERVPVQHSQLMPPPPPWLAGRFTGVDLSGVPEGLWLAVRQYLSRMQQLDPQVGWSMAERLATDVAACTGTRVPQGTPPVAFLAAVVAERQSRDTQRMFAGGRPPAGPFSDPQVGGAQAPSMPSMPSTPPLSPAPPAPPAPRDAVPAQTAPSPAPVPPEPPRTGFAPPA
ncbi:RDD family protein [Streptomyces sp. H10-C2]|uniref:RDD family protein n=1 Tax=unclassified Streptomyces TaxID=2593676 RepID=UPI0024B8F51C|nr:MULTISPECIES: RDD family protein [unclassified Streptomyces]MDJ0341244.1 RDD family protein [Streptomyces sp. PH10-H1]MDJ0370839.1 RDD family protein [Streptomyces sp. H10-C2]